MKTKSYLEEPNRHFVSASFEERHNKLFGCQLGQSTENNKALLFFSGKETIQTFSGSI